MSWLLCPFLNPKDFKVNHVHRGRELCTGPFLNLQVCIAADNLISLRFD